jgi:hypothetical protein
MANSSPGSIGDTAQPRHTINGISHNAIVFMLPPLVFFPTMSVQQRPVKYVLSGLYAAKEFLTGTSAINPIDPAENV